MYKLTLLYLQYELPRVRVWYFFLQYFFAPKKMGSSSRIFAFLAFYMVQFCLIESFHHHPMSLSRNTHLIREIEKEKFKHISYQLYMSPDTVDEDNDMEFDNSYRIESVKSGIFGALGGSIGSLPVAVIIGYFQKFNAQWELSHDALALSLFLFGVTYRYAVRGDINNKQLQLGVIGAFAVVRALNMVDVSSYCTSLPLNCGPPLFYFDIPMISIGLVNFFESLLAFGTAAAALELAFKSKFLTRC